MEAIVFTLIAALIIFIIRIIYNKYIVFTPNILIKISGKTSGSRQQKNENTFIAKWTPIIVFFNNSKHVAVNIEIFYLNEDTFTGSISNPIYFKEYTMLKGYEQLDILLSHEKLISRKLIKDYNLILKDFMPEEIKNLSFLLTFENEKGKRFYTEFKDDKAKTYKWKKRRFKKYFENK